ncbi:MAG: beta-ketoacyl synthase N-terminal-like domain-containing protein, partial [Bacteroidota bacterium]
MQGRKVAVVGMGGLFPTCTNLTDFEEKLFSNQSFVRTWDEAEQYGKQIRSKVSGYISLQEAGLEISDRLGDGDYPAIYYDQQERIPYVHLATADIGSIWAMLATQDAIQQAHWEVSEVQSERTGVSIGSGSGGHVVLRQAWELFFQKGKRSTFTGSHNVDRTMVYREAANVSCLFEKIAPMPGVARHARPSRSQYSPPCAPIALPKLPNALAEWLLVSPTWPRWSQYPLSLNAHMECA